MHANSLMARLMRQLGYPRPLQRLYVTSRDQWTRSKMERKFRRRDPFGYEQSAFDQARYGAILTALGNTRIDRALEIGCAEGAFTLRLAEHCTFVLALDIAETAIARARRRFAESGRANADFVCGNVRRWSPPAGSRFDWIFLADVFPYLEHQVAPDEFEAMARRIVGWMRPDGNLLVTNYFRTPEELGEHEACVACFARQGLSVSKYRIDNTAGRSRDIGLVLTVLGGKRTCGP